MKRIVVGMDGSDGAEIALRWAAREGELHGAEVTALLAWNLLGQPGGGFRPDFDEGDAQAALEAWLADAGLPVSVKAELACDLPPSALVDASSTADLVVVGTRGLGGFKELLLGSVSSAVAERAVSPVAVVRADPHPHGPVVAGVDGPAQALRSLQWAADEARVRGVDLDLVHAWTGSATPVFGLPFVVPLQHAEIAAERELDEVMERLDLHDLTVHATAVEGTPAGVLFERSKTAGVLVVGSRGRGGLTSILLGSTSRHLLHHAESPVVVVR